MNKKVLQVMCFVVLSLFLGYGIGISQNVPAALETITNRKVQSCVTVSEDQTIAGKFTRHTATGITTPTPQAPDVRGFIGAAYVTIGDIDKNGIKEIICTSGTGLDGDAMTKNDGAVAIFTWDGSNLDSWTTSVIYPSGTTGTLAFPNETILRDMDGDGDLDIMVMDNFIAGWFTKAPAGIYYLENQGGNIKASSNWILRTIYQGDPATQEGRSSYHRARFLDVDGDGDEDFITSKVCMWNWQSTTSQYNWVEWFRKESTGAFSGPYEIGDGGGFLFELADIDDDGDLDVIGPQFFIQNPGTLVVKGPGDIRGDTLAWFENPGVGGPVTQKWSRYTIDNWYTSSNPMGKAMETIMSDIDNDGIDEILFSNHNHQDYKPDGTYQNRIWPSGIYYLNIPGTPKINSSWAPVAIDTGNPLLDPYDLTAVANDTYAVDIPGGPYSQGSPGVIRAADMNGDGYPELVVPGDGKGVVYYYEAGGYDSGCLTYARAALYKDLACMPGDAKIVDIDGDGDLDIVSVIYNTSVNKDSYPDSSSVFVFEKKGVTIDSDRDGVPDSVDNCLTKCNTRQLDADNDHIGDVCDTTPGCGGCGQPQCEQQCGTSIDTDGDGISDNHDNCPTKCNSRQLDADNDQIGDVCDKTPGCGGCGQPQCEQGC